MSLANFGEQFAAKTLRKFYQTAVTPVITNSNYEGEIKKAGDRVNILSFLGDIALQDYSAGSDMSVDTIVDFEDQLVVEKRKYYNFPIDRLEEVFTYAGDISDTLIENARKTLERNIDSYVIEQAQYAKAGNWIGMPLRIVGSSADTEASIATSATGGTITIATASATQEGGNTYEAPSDGNTYSAGFYAEDVGRPIRLTSGASWATAWYRITAITNTSTVTVENWDGNIQTSGGGDFGAPTGDILRGLYGGTGGWEDGGRTQNGDGKPTTQAGWGWEIQAAIPTTLTAANVYEAVTLAAQYLDAEEVPDVDRHISAPPQFATLLRQASELQPAVAMAYEGVVLNGKVGRIGGFDVHIAVGSRVSTRTAHAGGSGNDADHASTAGTVAYSILANHTSFITFAMKWSESRVVDAENQFARKYQGLMLYGAKVPNMRRKAGVNIFAKLDVA